MSLIDKVNSVQGIALAALQATYNINTYLSTFVAPERGGIPTLSFNHTWSSLINNTIPTLLPISRSINTINIFLSKTEANSTYVSNVNINITLNNILNNSITVNSEINNIKTTLPSFLLINNFTGSINNYLRINNFNGSINNYLRIDNFNGSINNYLRIDNFNGSINNYLRIDNFNSSITTYLKTVDFNNTSINFVNTSNAQTINGNKSFNNLVKFKGSDNIIGGEPSIQIMPKDGNSGQSFLEFYRFPDGSMPVFGDRWLMGSDMESLNFLPRRSFSIWASSLNFRSPHLYITPTGQTVIPFGSFSCPTIHTNTLNINNTNINELYQSKTDMSNYLKTSDFNLTKSSLIDTISSQDINSVKRFFQNIIVKSGSGSINIYPQDFQIGEASIQYFRYADNATPQNGDTWIAGQDVLSAFGLTPQRSFSFWVGGGAQINSYSPTLYISPEGNVGLSQPLSTFSAPSIHTSTIRINGTNISVLYQSKSDMTTYITSGSLTNYVNTSTNQTILGKKTFSGGINTKSQIVAGATVLGNDILGGVARVSGSGNINLPSPVDNSGGRISFYFEADCALNTPSGNLIGTIGTGGSRQDITVASFGRHLECYSDGISWIIMRSSGDVSSITATTLGLGNVANTNPSGLPISNAVSSAMTLKGNLSGANFTGNITGITIHATTSFLVGGTNLSDIYLRTSNFSGSINNYLKTNDFTGSINNCLKTNDFTGSINNYLKTNDFTGSINNYLKTTDFTGSINNYLKTNDFTGSINNYLKTTDFTGSINNYLKTNDFTGSINNYLKTTDFTGSINNYLKTADYNITHTSIINTLNTKANANNPIFTGTLFSPIINATFLRENNVNISTIYELASNASSKYQIIDTNIQTLGQIIQRGNVVIDGILQQETWNSTININRQLIVKTSDVSPIFPMLVSPTQITMNSTLHINSSVNPVCVIRNTSNSGSGGSLRIITNQNIESSIGFNTSSDTNWVAGVGAYIGNTTDFGIGHNYLGSSILSLRLNRGGNAECNGSFTCTNLKTYPRNGSGDIAGLEVYNSSACPNGIEIIPNATGVETSMMFVGGSALDKFWVIGQNPFGVLPGNFAICSNYITGNPAGTVQANVGLQINQNGAVYIPNTLNTWVVNINQNAYIHTLQVNSNSYFIGGVFLNSININDIYQKRPFIHAMIDNNNGSILATRGIYSITAAKDGTIQGKWNITWTQAHPSGANYIPELALPENVGFCYCRDKTSTSMTVFTTDEQTVSNFNRKFTILIYNS